ncbi:MAG: glycoside hydrolase family 28 protein [Bacteroidales bacterium]|nr:glycoside hydrolase family 28 protein [Bacteroidales bacterium]
MSKQHHIQSFIFLFIISFSGNLLLASGYNIKKYGAAGDGKTIDSPAINEAISAASEAGGGTVYFPAGTYLCFSIRLKSHVGLYLDHGAVILAANPDEHEGGYDTAEPNEWDMYQDYGHSHWQNSLIWGIGLENISIAGPGSIDGRGLHRWDMDKPGEGNKAIALKNCRNVTIRDISMQTCGHFCILPTGVDNFTIDNLRIDTNRDAINIDCCRNVCISNCMINTPNDDAIVLKSSYALGYPRITENVMITNCLVSGYDLGTLLDGSFQKTQKQAPDGGGVTGRIKLGTESNGGFKNITITNCTFDHCRGLALETVDGGILEDITISNITMNDITNVPLFLRLGRRMRAPEGMPVGKMRRIIISNLIVNNASPEYGSLILGIPGHPVEDVKLSNIQILVKGGAPGEYMDIEVPELEDGYPDPRFFGKIPAYGFFIRHARGIEMNNVEIGFMEEDLRPAFILDDVKDADFNHVKTQKVGDVPTFMLRMVRNFKTHNCQSVPDTKLDSIEQKEL